MWSRVVDLATLVFGSLVLGTLGSVALSKWPIISRRTRFTLLGGAAASGLLALGGIAAGDKEAAETRFSSPAGPIEDEGVPPEEDPTRDNATWFDAEGRRAGIVFRDEFTPWADQASFNCLVGTPTYGDERAFFDARQKANTARGAYETVLDVMPGDHVVLRIYVHNCADPAVNSATDRRGDAIGSRVRVSLPNDPADHSQVFAFISATNARPAWVADGLDLRSSVPIVASFVEGTARVYSNKLAPDWADLSTDGLVVETVASPGGPGSLIGTPELDGVLPADGFRSTLIIQIEIQISEP